VNEQRLLIAVLLAAFLLLAGPVWLLAQRQAGRPVPFTTPDKGQYSQFSQLLCGMPSSSDLPLRTHDRAGFSLAISDISDRRVWQQIRSANQRHSYVAHNDPPQINFSNSIIVAIILGPSGGASEVNITAVSGYPDHMGLSLDRSMDEHTSPSLAIISHPYQIVSLPKLDKPLSTKVRHLSSKGR
jgi:hypothetical protein